MDPALLLPRRQLQVGSLLAEGGEGRVYELADGPDRVFKAYRVPPPAVGLVDLVSWATGLSPAAAGRVRASTAWPTAVVVDRLTGGAAEKGDAPTAAGLVMPRAPRRFSLRHRDGRSHLASLSYLTAEPAHRSAAYGIDLPPPMSPERLGLVYALARLLEAFESTSPAVSHGDLSAKNVLWSLARGPEVFVLDCDNGERFVAGTRLGSPHRRRAMTPNWDDPAVPSGSNPGPESDRYSLALIFLRVCGAAHYPVQKPQKAGEALSLEIGVPGGGRRVRGLAPGAPVWELCARGLSVTGPRPPAAAWVEVLGAIIGELGATRILDAVAASQGREALAPPVVVAATSRAAGAPAAAAEAGAAVMVAPVPLGSRQGTGIVTGEAATRLPAGPGWTEARSQAAGRAGSGGWTSATAGARRRDPGPLAAPAIPGTSVWAQACRLLRSLAAWLAAEHRATVRDLCTPGRRWLGLVRVPWCVAVDFFCACVVFFLVAMIASPFLGI